MFTGLVEQVATVTRLSHEDSQEIFELCICPTESITPEHGESIAVNGICLTVAAVQGNTIIFHVSKETLARSNVLYLETDQIVNIERALRLSARLGGHLLSGHVDCVGTVTEVHPSIQGWELKLQLPIEAAPYVIHKGSIGIDGVSLTINSIQDTTEGPVISVMLIPTTLQKTTLGGWKSGYRANIEFDLVGKYILRAEALAQTK